MKKILSNISGILGNKKDLKLEGDIIENSIILALFYISKNIMSSGRFVYRNSTNPDKIYSGKQYSSLRHAGTLYSMYQCEKYLGKNALKKKRILASEYLIKNYIKKIDFNMYGLVSKPNEEAPIFLSTSGGTGLALSALVNLLGEGKVSLSLLRKMGNFLLFMQADNGDFTPSWEFGTMSKSEVFSARYYPGEACLGLLNLYEADRDEKWLAAAKKGLLRLAKVVSLTPIENIKFNHWGMLALQKLFSIENNGLTKDEQIILSTYADKNINYILSRQITDEKNIKYGGFETTKSLCGVSTILEGMIAAYDCVEANVLKMRIINSVNIGLSFVAKYQVKVGDMEGGIPKSHLWNTLNAVNDDKEIRIDYVQHTLSALVMYKNLLNLNAGV